MIRNTQYAFLLAFAALYIQTMPPGMSSWIIEGWDSAVLQITGSTWGFPHSPGYPLYTILSNLFVRWLNVVPALWETSPVWRVSLWSTTTSLLTLFFVYAILCKLTRLRAVALSMTTILGFSFVFWRGAIMTEVYSFNTLIFALTYWLALLWRKRREAHILVILGLVLGAGVVHHRTALILPLTIAAGVVLHTLVWRSLPPKSPLQEGTNTATPSPSRGRLGGGRDSTNEKLSISAQKLWRNTLIPLLTVTLPAFIPLLSYLYLPWAASTQQGQTWLYANAADWNTFWFILLSREWWGLVQPPSGLNEWLAAAQILLNQQAEQITLIGVICGVLGLMISTRQRWLFLPPTVFLAYFGTAYRVVDVDSMLISLTMTLCIGWGALVGQIIHVSSRWLNLSKRWATVIGSVTVIVVSGLVFTPMMQVNWKEVDLSHDWQAEDLVEEVVAIAEAGTPLVIIGQDNSVLPDFIYAQRILGHEIEPLSATTLGRMDEADSRTLLADRFAAGLRVLVDQETIELGFIRWLSDEVASEQIFFAPTGHPYLWELLPRPFTDRLPDRENLQLNQPPAEFLNGQLELLATSQRVIRKRSGCFLRLTLFWQTQDSYEADYYIAVHPYGDDGVFDKNDHLALMRGYLPFPELQSGELVRDEVDLIIRQPDQLANSQILVNLYQVQDGAFPSFGQVVLPVQSDGRCD